MAITRDEVRHVARLAHLELGEDEVETFTRQLNRILEAMARLQELDTSGVEPTAHALDVQGALREDEPRPGLARELALAGAPDAAEGCFRVPRVVDLEEPRSTEGRP